MRVTRLARQLSVSKETFKKVSIKKSVLYVAHTSKIKEHFSKITQLVNIYPSLSTLDKKLLFLDDRSFDKHKVLFSAKFSVPFLDAVSIQPDFFPSYGEDSIFSLDEEKSEFLRLFDMAVTKVPKNNPKKFLWRKRCMFLRNYLELLYKLKIKKQAVSLQKSSLNYKKIKPLFGSLVDSAMSEGMLALLHDKIGRHTINAYFSPEGTLIVSKSLKKKKRSLDALKIYVDTVWSPTIEEYTSSSDLI